MLHWVGLLGVYELLEKFDAKSRGYLITSHAEEIRIQESCEKLGVWLIPKSLASDVILQKDETPKISETEAIADVTTAFSTRH